ncbi:MAG: threonine synthase [Ilumatobacteraceae bacterium]
MRYVSTRGSAPELGFADVVLAGLAVDGGLYVPTEWPALPPLPAGSYADLAATVARPYVGDDLDSATLSRLCHEAYAGFRHSDVVPIVELEPGHHLMELFHGPTLAFKDLALQLLGRLFDHVLRERGERVTIVGATSGDTGSAAIDGVKSCTNVDIVILYPHGRVSDVQRRQMTTVDAPNVRTVAIDGTFDDCQDLVKAMFNDAPFRERHGLSAVNSINWARVMAQVVYHVEATRRLGTIDVTVPTGNFGNVLSAWIARQMGAPIRHLVVASNENDILTRFFETHEMASRGVHPSLSPRMDIQVSSNFERLLFEMNQRDGAVTSAQMARFRERGSLAVEPDQWAEWIAPVFRASRASDHDTLETMRRVYESTGLLLDPHTAVGVKAAREWRDDAVPMVTMATAHPAKFPDAVERATGVRPELPEHLADLMERPEKTTRLVNDLAVVEQFVDDFIAT